MQPQSPEGDDKIPVNDAQEPQQAPQNVSENPYAPPTSTLDPVDSAEQDQDEEDALRAFVGSRANYYLAKWRPALENQIESSAKGFAAGVGVNWAAFLFSGLWMAYRKMYRYAFILFAFIIVESILEEILFVGILGLPESPTVLANAINLGIAIVCGAFGNFWYLSHGRKVIRDAKAQPQNSESRLAEIQRRGGTSILAVFGALLIFLAGLAGAFFFLALFLY